MPPTILVCLIWRTMQSLIFDLYAHSSTVAEGCFLIKKGHLKNDHRSMSHTQIGYHMAKVNVDVNKCIPP